MGSLISTPIAFILEKLFELEYILRQFPDKIKSTFGKTQETTAKRFDMFDVRATHDMKKLGILPNDKEWELELPNQV